MKLNEFLEEQYCKFPDDRGKEFGTMATQT